MKTLKLTFSNDAAVSVAKLRVCGEAQMHGAGKDKNKTYGEQLYNVAVIKVIIQ